MGEKTDIEFLDKGPSLEQNYRTLEQKIRGSDPRDYLRVTTFQKHARTIDKDPDHPWEVEPDYFTWSNDPECEVVVATVLDVKNKQKGLLLAAKATNNEPITAYLTKLEPSVRDFAYEITRLVTSRFPVMEKPVFIQNLIDANPGLVNMSPDRASFQIATLALDLLPDYPSAVVLDKEIDLPRVYYGEPEASREQQIDLQKFLTLLSTKMDPKIFQENLDKFIKDIPFTDHIYGINFKYIFSDALGWLVASRPETEIDDSYFNSKQTERAATFPVKDLIKRKISSDEELKTVLSKMPVKPEPDIRYLKHGPKVAEFVDLEKIVGGLGIINWSIVSTSEGRGFENIKMIVDGFTNGTLDISGHNQPMDVVEVAGDYFIRNDGRHRVAAMKALGIPFAPMMVTHVRQI